MNFVIDYLKVAAVFSVGFALFVGIPFSLAWLVGWLLMLWLG